MRCSTHDLGPIATDCGRDVSQRDPLQATTGRVSLGDGTAAREAVALQHPVEGTPVDAEHGGGAAHVTAVLVQHLGDVAALELVQRRPVARYGGGRLRARLAYLDR